MLSMTDILVYGACIAVGLIARTWQVAALGGLILGCLPLLTLLFLSWRDGMPFPLIAAHVIVGLFAFSIVTGIVFGLKAVFRRSRS